MEYYEKVPRLGSVSCCRRSVAGCCRIWQPGPGHLNAEWRRTMFDIERLMKVMSEILSDRYDMKITLTAVPKDEAAA